MTPLLNSGLMWWNFVHVTYCMHAVSKNSHYKAQQVVAKSFYSQNIIWANLG